MREAPSELYFMALRNNFVKQSRRMYLTYSVINRSVGNVTVKLHCVSFILCTIETEASNFVPCFVLQALYHAAKLHTQYLDE